MRRWIRIALTVVAIGVLWLGAGTAGAPAGSAPTSFQLVFVGRTVLASYPSPSGAAHVGTFTTNSALCPSGSGQDIAETALGVGTRLFTCDGSGATFTATINPHIGEYTGAGSWQIVSGTGPLGDLRGEGTFSSVLTSGDPSDIPGNLLALAFRSTWTGTVALDATPPTLALTKDTATKLRRPAGRYRFDIILTLHDNGGGPVSYTVNLLDPATLDILVRKSGTTSTGSLGWTFSLKPRARARTLRLEVEASDQVGNQATLTHAIALRR